MARVANTLEYPCWRAMKSRCTNPRGPSYPRYGGRGITVCERWMCSFHAFVADLGPRPSPQHSLDRIDNAGNYEPGNVRWATRQQQTENRACTNIIILDGDVLTTTQAGARLGIKRNSMLQRLVSGKTPSEIAYKGDLRHLRSRVNGRFVVEPIRAFDDVIT